MGRFPKGDTSWFTHDRFGMFINWGLHSLPARHEWIQQLEEIPPEIYSEKYFTHFDPDRFDPGEWARTAREAGMKYMVFSTKHHEGFCLWDSRHTDYKVTNTPYGRDVLGEVVEAFRKEDIRIGLYYSLIDWHHPDFVIDSIHPLYRHPDRDKLNSGRDMNRYRSYLHGQIRELLTDYGRIDVLWLDYSYPSPDGKGHLDWDSEGLVRMIREIQPWIILNDRLDLPDSGDVITPEQHTPDMPLEDDKGSPVIWEGCHTFSGSWGYHRDETSWKSAKQCIDLLVNHVCRNGNLLMNIGPTARGELDPRAKKRLRDYARWMSLHGRSIHGCGMAEGLEEPRDCRYTYNQTTNRLYLHIMNWPFKHVHLPGLAGKVAYARFLHDDSEVLFRESTTSVDKVMNSRTPDGAVTLELPVFRPKVIVPVVELLLK